MARSHLPLPTATRPRGPCALLCAHAARPRARSHEQPTMLLRSRAAPSVRRYAGSGAVCGVHGTHARAVQHYAARRAGVLAVPPARGTQGWLRPTVQAPRGRVCRVGRAARVRVHVLSRIQNTRQRPLVPHVPPRCARLLRHRRRRGREPPHVPPVLVRRASRVSAVQRQSARSDSHRTRARLLATTSPGAAARLSARTVQKRRGNVAAVWEEHHGPAWAWPARQVSSLWMLAPWWRVPQQPARAWRWQRQR